jgi:hypothetical protein
MTNGDKIRQMSNEELAKEFAHNSLQEKCDVCVYKDRTGFCNTKKDCEEGIKAFLHMEIQE